jgi:signal transduction histidine kinase
MKFFGYKHIARLIMISTILLILFNTLLISLFYYQNQINEYDESIITLRYEHINQQKNILKKDIMQLLDMIYYKYDNDIKSNEEKILEFFGKVDYQTAKGNYIFVYELLDKKGGEKFAKMLVNPNRPDIQGNYLSTEYRDSRGFAFRKAFLEGINAKGEAFVKYHYKKTNGVIGEKISYFYYFEPLNWVIAKGIYLDDIKKEVDIKKKNLEHRLQIQIKQNIFFFLFFSLIAMIIAYISGKKIQNVINQKDKKVKQTTKALTTLNKELDQRVKDAVEKNKQQQKILMQKSKLIALGEMISLIAHQWRQPISELNAIILNIKMHYKMDKLDNDTMDKKTKDMENILEYMSKTIDDFRTFFKPDKQKEEFYIYRSLSRVLDISSSIIKEHNIVLNKNIDKTIKIENYQNEFEQVLLNLITNAKDALLNDDIKNPTITIDIFRKNDKVMIQVSDNANGIDEDIIDKIFRPYFTTKEESDGTGIGLYMSKMIIEENMKGELIAKTSPSGSSFIITLPTIH